MKLSSLIKNCALVSPADFKAEMASDPEILSITSSSEKVKQGTLFIAVKGFRADGHDYIDQAFAKGATAVLAQYKPENLKNSDCIFLVENSRLAMASVANRFYGNPSKDMTLVGITGTNGKTTTTWILENIFKTCGFQLVLLGQ